MSKELLYNYAVFSTRPQLDVSASHPWHWTTPSGIFVKVNYDTAMFMLDENCMAVGVVIRESVGDFLTDRLF